MCLLPAIIESSHLKGAWSGLQPHLILELFFFSNKDFATRKWDMFRMAFIWNQDLNLHGGGRKVGVWCYLTGHAPISPTVHSFSLDNTVTTNPHTVTRGRFGHAATVRDDTTLLIVGGYHGVTLKDMIAIKMPGTVAVNPHLNDNNSKCNVHGRWVQRSNLTVTVIMTIHQSHVFWPFLVWYNTQGHGWSKVIVRSKILGQKILHIPWSRSIWLLGMLRKHN